MLLHLVEAAGKAAKQRVFDARKNGLTPRWRAAQPALGGLLTAIPFGERLVLEPADIRQVDAAWRATGAGPHLGVGTREGGPQHGGVAVNLGIEARRKALPCGSRFGKALGEILPTDGVRSLERLELQPGCVVVRLESGSARST
ncbi:hypothetical protein [Afifella aestuarii]|uniref:hypothetical protein n=1 Tax=Afifella aestuarii TaxID=1909496 RepID=UPI000FE2B028|nr:hypothetical protein [Afifella aestuarii]